MLNGWFLAEYPPDIGGYFFDQSGSVTYELVAKSDSLTFYVSAHGKPIMTQGAMADAAIYAGNYKTMVVLEPAGDNRMTAKGSFKVGVGVRVALTATLAGKSEAKANFNLK